MYPISPRGSQECDVCGDCGWSLARWAGVCPAMSSSPFVAQAKCRGPTLLHKDSQCAAQLHNEAIYFPMNWDTCLYIMKIILDAVLLIYISMYYTKTTWISYGVLICILIFGKATPFHHYYYCSLFLSIIGY